MLEPMKELVDRTRRIETRMMKYFEHQGFDTQVQRPLWRNGRVEVPTLACSLHDCLNVVPQDWPKDDEIDVWHKGNFVMTFFTSPG